MKEDDQAKVVGAIGGAAGIGGSVGAVSAAGAVTGLSAAGLAITAAAPLAITIGAYGIYKLLKS